MSGVVLHIGLPKTGTTTLQKAVFPHLAGVLYAGKRIPGYDFIAPALASAIAATIAHDSIGVDPVPELRSAIAAQRAHASSDTLLISTESFAHPAATDMGVVAARLAAAVPEARILITLRAQDALALSWYRSHGRFAQYLFTQKRESERIRASLSQRAWWNMVTRTPSSGFLAMMNFDAIEACYARLFAARVTVLPIEWMQRGDARYAEVLGRVLEVASSRCAQLLQGAHENRGLSRREVLVGKALGLIGLRADFLEHRSRSVFRGFLARGASADQTLHAEIAHGLRSQCAQGNARLAARTGVDLAALGYPVA